MSSFFGKLRVGLLVEVVLHHAPRETRSGEPALAADNHLVNVAVMTLCQVHYIHGK